VIRALIKINDFKKASELVKKFCMTSEECNDFPEIKKYLATIGIEY